jgi:hypothetical protein
VSEESLEMRHFQALAHLEEPGVAASWAAGVARDGRNEKTPAPMEAVGGIIAGGQEAKKEILAKMEILESR